MTTKASDTTLTQDYPGIASAHDVLGCSEELLESGAHPALEEHGPRLLSGRLEQSKILHIARSDLKNIGVAGDQLDILWSHNLGHDWQPGLTPGLRQQFQPLSAEPLEAIGGGPGLKCATSQR
jgi:hypothetical protein